MQTVSEYKKFVTRDYMDGYNKRDSYYKFIPRHSYFFNSASLFKSIIRKGSLVLDFGCGNGSMGGFGEYQGFIIEGYDRDINNYRAIFHDLNDVRKSFDVVLFSQVLEHGNFDELANNIKWAKCHADEVIIGLPNGSNPFMAAFFFNELTHIKNYDSDGFLFWLEKNGLKVNKIYHSDIDLDYTNVWSIVRSLKRCVDVYSWGFSPFKHTIIVCEVLK